MVDSLRVWKGSVEINGVTYTNVDDARSVIQTIKSDTHIFLRSSTYRVAETSTERKTIQDVDSSTIYKIKVRQYMTRKSTPEFDFMAHWNDDNPMPLRVMVGTKERETEKMVYMKLHGDIVATQVMSCMKCGRIITNPISQFFGMGPECGGHNYINPFEDDDALKEAVEAYREKMKQITWEGWVIKSAIEEESIYGH